MKFIWCTCVAWFSQTAGDEREGSCRASNWPVLGLAACASCMLICCVQCIPCTCASCFTQDGAHQSGQGEGLGRVKIFSYRHTNIRMQYVEALIEFIWCTCVAWFAQTAGAHAFWSKKVVNSRNVEYALQICSYCSCENVIRYKKVLMNNSVKVRQERQQQQLTMN